MWLLFIFALGLQATAPPRTEFKPVLLPRRREELKAWVKTPPIATVPTLSLSPIEYVISPFFTAKCLTVCTFAGPSEVWRQSPSLMSLAWTIEAWKRLYECFIKCLCSLKQVSKVWGKVTWISLSIFPAMIICTKGSDDGPCGSAMISAKTGLAWLSIARMRWPIASSVNGTRPVIPWPLGKRREAVLVWW